MNWKYRITLAFAAAAIVAAFFFYRTPFQTSSVAKSPDDGMIMPGTNGKARLYPNDVIKIEPDGFAITTALRDLPDAKDQPAEPFAEQKLEKAREERRDRERQAKGLPALTEEQKEQWEINERNAERVKRTVPGAGLAGDEFTDPLAALSVNPKAPQAMPTPTTTFDGAGMADNSSAGAGTGFTPPDTNGDVGPNHYVSSINLVLKVYNKNGTVAAAGKKTSDLFASLPAGDPCRTRNDGDPVVIYDSLADRWVVNQFSLPAGIAGTGTNNYQCIAVSTTPDPTGTYYVWSYLYPGNALNDYPKIGVWPDAYHITFNQFNNAGTAFLGMGFMSQDRPKALAGDPTTSIVYKNIFSVDPNAGGALPTDFDGFVPPPAGMAEVIAEFRSVSFGDPLDAMRFYKWVPDFVTPANSTLTVLPDVALASFDARSPTSTSSVMEVLSGATLDGLNDRMMHRLAYRNLGTYAAPVNSYVGNFTVNVSGVNPTSAGTYQGGIRWWEMRRTNDTFTVTDQGTQSNGPGNGATGLNNWMGSIAQDNQGNIALGYSQSSTTQRANIMIVGRTGAPSGSLDQGEALFFAAPASQSSSSRWGDYSSMTVDPTDDCTFWYTQEYYAAASSSNFSSRVGNFKFPGCTAAPKGTISGTITSCSTGLPVGTASVDATGGFNRLTVANGTYSMTVAPGAYTVNASKSGGYIGASSNTNVTNGGNSTVDICLNGVAVVSAGTTSIVAESCGVGNGVPDPGENITVSLPISNTGAANTSNLTATLQATGGVTNPGPTQNYGVITAGGPSVSKDFTFTVDPGVSCGNSITLTWSLQDGATNFGTVTKTYSTGSPIINLTQNFDGVTAPALPAGWTQNQTSGTGITWVTSTTSPNSAPNVAFANDPSTVNASAIESPVFAVSVPNAALTFQKAFTTESTFDGVVLEIKIGAGSWTDIVTAGGSFVSGGYNATISSNFQSPIAGRQAWSGSFPTFTTTSVTLPAAANGQNVQLRWLMASDSSVSSTGFRLDDVSVTAGVSCALCTSTVKSRADFDGDGKTDISVFRPSEGNWYLNRSTAGFTVINWGLSSDVLVPGDYDGDGKADTAIFRASPTLGVSDYYILNSNGFVYSGAEWGTTGDIPIAGDYDGDGKTDLAVFRPSTGVWYVLNSSNGSNTIAPFGQTGDVPMAMDSDGDGKTNLAVFRPSNNTWYIARNTGVPAQNFDAVVFGSAGDILVPADYDGDNKDDVAVFRPSNGTWYIRRSSDSGVTITQFGLNGDVPVPGDYDGDGKDDVAVYRGGTWYLNRSTAGFTAQVFGLPTDAPIPAKYHP